MTLEVYRVTRTFPKDEQYGLISQMRRSASSIPTNIAEGCGRNSEADFHRFLVMAYGSASELDYQFILAQDLEYLDSTQHTKLESELHEIRRMLHTLMKRLKT